MLEPATLTPPVLTAEMATALAVIAPPESTLVAAGIPAASGETAVQSLEEPTTEYLPHSVANPTANPVVHPALPVGLRASRSCTRSAVRRTACPRGARPVLSSLGPGGGVQLADEPSALRVQLRDAPGWAGLRRHCAPLSLFPTRSRRFADKVLQSDFIHTAQAAPIYFETTDSFADSRQRFGGVQAQLAQESRLDSLMAAQMVKMDGQCKRLMDGLRITARNLFYQLFQPFKGAYDNYRDDHDHFRKLTQAPGVIEVSAQQIVIHLLPRTNYGGELKKAVIQALAGLNAQGLDHPRWPGRKLKSRLSQRSEMELKMNPLP